MFPTLKHSKKEVLHDHVGHQDQQWDIPIYPRWWLPPSWIPRNAQFRASSNQANLALLNILNIFLWKKSTVVIIAGSTFWELDCCARRRLRPRGGHLGLRHYYVTAGEFRWPSLYCLTNVIYTQPIKSHFWIVKQRTHLKLGTLSPKTGVFVAAILDYVNISYRTWFPMILSDSSVNLTYMQA